MNSLTNENTRLGFIGIGNREAALPDVCSNTDIGPHKGREPYEVNRRPPSQAANPRQRKRVSRLVAWENMEELDARRRLKVDKPR